MLLPPPFLLRNADQERFAIYFHVVAGYKVATTVGLSGVGVEGEAMPGAYHVLSLVEEAGSEWTTGMRTSRIDGADA